MPKFVYEGDSPYATAGISQARFNRGVVNEVSDERLAGYLRTLDGFREVTEAEVPPTPPQFTMPVQGQPHPHAGAAAALLTDPTTEGKVQRAGNLARDDQRAANTEAVTEQMELTMSDTTQGDEDQGGQQGDQTQPPPPPPPNEDGDKTDQPAPNKSARAKK